MQILNVFLEGGTYQVEFDDGSHMAVPAALESIQRAPELRLWLDAGNVPGIRAKLKPAIAAAITTQANRRIDQVGGDLRGQLRKLMKAMKLMDKRATVGLTPAERQEESKFRDLEVYFTAVRTAEKTAAASLDAMTQDQLDAFDPAKISWPAPPA